MVRRWTAAETQLLRDLASAKLPKFRIAAILERTTHAIELQSRKHGIKLGRLRRSHYLAKAD